MAGAAVALNTLATSLCVKHCRFEPVSLVGENFSEFAPPRESFLSVPRLPCRIALRFLPLSPVCSGRLLAVDEAFGAVFEREATLRGCDDIGTGADKVGVRMMFDSTGMVLLLMSGACRSGPGDAQEGLSSALGGGAACIEGSMDLSMTELLFKGHGLVSRLTVMDVLPT
jgi:hypothetical protein